MIERIMTKMSFNLTFTNGEFVWLKQRIF